MLAHNRVLWRRSPALCASHPRPSPRSTRASSTVPLAYDLYEPPSTPSSAKPPTPILFLHGLFGSKTNNRGMSKALARSLKTPVYALDLRNHGASPHAPAHDYSALAADVRAFMAARGLDRAALIGHSMGAKTAMVLALGAPERVSALVAVDNAPVDAVLGSEFPTYVKGMRAVQEREVGSQREADEVLREYAPDLAVRQFLLTNLVRASPSAALTWRIPLATLAAALPALGDFPFKDPDAASYKGPALFVRGTHSRYVADEALPTVGRFFPRFELADIEAGHWVMAEKPEEFRRVVEEFLREKE